MNFNGLFSVFYIQLGFRYLKFKSLLGSAVLLRLSLPENFCTAQGSPTCRKYRKLDHKKIQKFDFEGNFPKRNWSHFTKIVQLKESRLKGIEGKFQYGFILVRVFDEFEAIYGQFLRCTIYRFFAHLTHTLCSITMNLQFLYIP